MVVSVHKLQGVPQLPASDPVTLVDPTTQCEFVGSTTAHLALKCLPYPYLPDARRTLPPGQRSLSSPSPVTCAWEVQRPTPGEQVRNSPALVWAISGSANLLRHREETIDNLKVLGKARVMFICPSALAQTHKLTLERACRLHISSSH